MELDNESAAAAVSTAASPDWDPDAEVAAAERDRQSAAAAPGAALADREEEPAAPPATPTYASALREWDADTEVAPAERDWRSAAELRAASEPRMSTLARVLTAALDCGWPISDFALLASACQTTREAGLLHARGLLTSAGGQGNRLHYGVAECEGSGPDPGKLLRSLLVASHPVAVQTALRQHARRLPPPAAQAVQEVNSVALGELVAFRYPAGAVGVDAPAVTPVQLAGARDGEGAAAVYALLLAQFCGDESDYGERAPSELAACLRTLLPVAAAESAEAAAAERFALPWPLRGERERDEHDEEMGERFECVGGATLLHIAIATPGIDVETLELLLRAPGGAAALEVEAPPCGTPLAQCLASARPSYSTALATGIPAALVRAGARMAARSVSAAPGVLLAALWRRREKELPTATMLGAMLDAGFLEAGADDPERAASTAVLSLLLEDDVERKSVLARCTAAAGGEPALAAALRHGLARTPYLATGLELGAAAGRTGWLRQLHELAGGRLLSAAVVLHDYGDTRQRGERSMAAAAIRGGHVGTLAFLLECAAAGAAAPVDGAAPVALGALLGGILEAALHHCFDEDAEAERAAEASVAALLAAGADPARLLLGRLSVLCCWVSDECAAGALRPLAAALLQCHRAAVPAGGDAAQGPRSAAQVHLARLVAELAVTAVSMRETQTLRAVAAHWASLPHAETGAALITPEAAVLAAMSSHAPIDALHAAFEHGILPAQAPPGSPPLSRVVLRAAAGACLPNARSQHAELLWLQEVPGNIALYSRLIINVLGTLRTRGYSFSAGGGSPLHGSAIVGEHACPALLRCFGELGVLATPALVNVRDQAGFTPLARCRQALANPRIYNGANLREVDAILAAAGGIVEPAGAAAAAAAAAPAAADPPALPRASAATLFPTVDEAFAASFYEGQKIRTRITADQYRLALAQEEAGEARWRLPPQGLF